MDLAHRLLYVLIRRADKFIFLNYYCMATKCIYLYIFVDFPGGSIPESGRSPRGGNDNLFQCSCLGNPVDRMSLVGYSPWGHKELDRTEVTEHTCMQMDTSFTNTIPLLNIMMA